jgi:hypothetical protein
MSSDSPYINISVSRQGTIKSVFWASYSVFSTLVSVFSFYWFLNTSFICHFNQSVINILYVLHWFHTVIRTLTTSNLNYLVLRRQQYAFCSHNTTNNMRAIHTVQPTVCILFTQFNQQYGFCSHSVTNICTDVKIIFLQTILSYLWHVLIYLDHFLGVI